MKACPHCNAEMDQLGETIWICPLCGEIVDEEDSE